MIGTLNSIWFWVIAIVIILFIVWLTDGNRGGGIWEGLDFLSPLNIIKGGGSDFEPLFQQPNLFNTDNSYTSDEESEEVDSTMTAEEKKELIAKKRVSRGEAICREVMEDIFGKPFPSAYPEFLRNPESNKKLEIDCYNDELKLGVEYQGSQHYKFPHKYHNGDIDNFKSQLRRDDFKFRMCEKNGICLIRVPYTVPFHGIRDYILERLPAEYKWETNS
jgi:hypothetical protein